MQAGATLGSIGLIPGLLGAVGQAPQQFGGYGQGLMNLAALRSAQAPQQFNFQSPYGQQIQQQSMAAPQQFGYTPDLAGRTQEIFGQQAEMLQPEFQRQATELQGRLFGSGRLGLRLAGESQGLGADSGMVSPDALGLGRAQQQTLANLATTSRQQALGEEEQRYQQELGTFGTNVAQQQQALQNLMGAEAQLFGQQAQQYGLGQTAEQQALQNLLSAQGQGFSQAAQAYGLGQGAQQQQIQNAMALQQGLFGQALGLGQLEQGLYAGGLANEQARAAAALGAGQLAVAPYSTAADMQQRQQEANAGFFGALAGGIGTAKASDIRLKENINHVDTLPNGIKLYTWEWKEDRNDPTFGVLAQEVQQVIPEAVIEHPDGYLMVDYSHPKLQGVH
jgi:hypothetical protein